MYYLHLFFRIRIIFIVDAPTSNEDDFLPLDNMKRSRKTSKDRPPETQCEVLKVLVTAVITNLYHQNRQCWAKRCLAVLDQQSQGIRF